MQFNRLIGAFAICLCCAATAQQRSALLESDPAFFKTEDAARIGEQILVYQRCTGGWPKNIDMARRMTDAELAQVLSEKSRRDDSTIDNNATTTQMIYLARLYKATGESRYKDGFDKGVEYLLSGQYENGGWPQFWPEMDGYQVHITFNDNAISNTLRMFDDIVNGREPYGGDIVDDALRTKLKASFDKGIDCILNSQIVVKGKPTVWCQQVDRETLAPAGARAFELASFCSAESADIVELLMSIPNPDKRVKAAVHGAMAWYDKYKLTGLRYDRGRDEKGERYARLVADENAAPIWARFYDLELNEPFVCDRDGVPRRHLEQIGRERRCGYAWYSSAPARLYPMYEAWAAANDPRHKVKISLSVKGANENGTIDMFRKPVMDKADFNVVVKPSESIQKAISKAAPDQATPFKILVLKGTYRQRIVIDRPNIVLIGEDRASTVLALAEDDAEARTDDKKVDGTVITLEDVGSDCIISGFTIRNEFDAAPDETMEPYQVKHRFAVRGAATRTIIINCTISSNGNDALALWAKGGGMYYHADLEIDCPGVDYICPRGWCYATRCTFNGGGGRAMLWHDGRDNKDKKFVITNSDFNASEPTLLGRYHHDCQFYILNCRLGANILNRDIQYAYSDHVLDPCELGQRVYYYRCSREGGHSGWLDDNLEQAENSVPFWAMTADWTFDGKWDPEKTIRDMWKTIAY